MICQNFKFQNKLLIELRIIPASIPATVSAHPSRGIKTNLNPAAMAYFMSVSDPAAYAQAFSNFIGQNEDVGQSFLSSIMADGEDPATHVVLNYGNSLGELVMNQPQALDGWSDYASDVRDLRTVEATAVLNVVKRWD